MTNNYFLNITALNFNIYRFLRALKDKISRNIFTELYYLLSFEELEKVIFL